MGNIATKKMYNRTVSTLVDVLELEDNSVAAEKWDNVPKFEQRAKKAAYTLNVFFRNKEDLEKFADLINVPSLKHPGRLTTKSMWYPELEYGERGQNCQFVWMSEDDPEVQKLLNGEDS